MAFLTPIPTSVNCARVGARSPLRACSRVRTPYATATQPTKPTSATSSVLANPQPSNASPPTPTPEEPIVDGPYAQFMIWGLRELLRAQTGIKSQLAGYAGLVEECQLLLAREGAEEQRRLVEALLNAAVIPPVGVWLFRNLFSHRPGFNADLTPLAFSWLVGPSERNQPPEGGEGVYITKCRFLEQARCKGLCVNMCQQPVQNLFTYTLGLPLRMTPNYEDNSCQMSFGVHPLSREEDPALNLGCLAECALGNKFSAAHSGKECTVQPDDMP